MRLKFMQDRRLRRGNSRGFTLIELLVVVAIIGVLATVAVGKYTQSIKRAKEAVLKENLFRMRTAISLYFADKGHYPFDINTLVDDDYLHKMPIDPITESADTWMTIQSEQDDADISSEPGISDVQSGATGQARDGTYYSEW